MKAIMSTGLLRTDLSDAEAYEQKLLASMERKRKALLRVQRAIRRLKSQIAAREAQDYLP